MIFVGDDWSEDHHDIEVLDESGKRLSRRRLPEGVEGMAQLHALLAEHAEEPSQVVLAIETDRGLWVAALVAAGYLVEPCTGTGGYRDIGPTSQVTVKNQDGTILAVSQLGPGETVEARRTQYTVYSHCLFEFQVGPVPRKPFYQIEVSRRGAVTYSQDDLERKGWKLELSLG